MGASTIRVGMFTILIYSTIRAVDKFPWILICLPGCPPKPEGVIDAITKLPKKGKSMKIELSLTSDFTKELNRSFTINHNSLLGPSIHTGN